MALTLCTLTSTFVISGMGRKPRLFALCSACFIVPTDEPLGNEHSKVNHLPDRSYFV